MAEFAIRQGESAGFNPRGGALQLWKCKDLEVMLSGPSETGKTYSSLQKLDALLWKYPGSTAAILRKSLTSVYTTVLRTYKNVLGPNSPVSPYGGEKPEWFDYPNGSRVYIGGLDNPQKTLSSERDFIYVNQAEELLLSDWEVLTTRVTGRAAVAPYSQLFGDCNPGAPQHWIKNRPSLRFFESRHEDNPTLFDEQGNITERGKKTIAILDALTGVRKLRLRYGQWVQAEGVVYDQWFEAIHLVDRFPIPKHWKRYRAVDFGFGDPMVVQWWAVDPDGRMYLYREIYFSQRTVDVHAAEIQRLERWFLETDPKKPNPERERIEITVADHDRGDRAILERCGILSAPAFKLIEPGYKAVMERLKPAHDGKPRLFVLRDSTVETDPILKEKFAPLSTVQEFGCYRWKVCKITGRILKEEPEDKDNHGMDAMRYLVCFLDDIKAVNSTAGLAGAAKVRLEDRRESTHYRPFDTPDRFDRDRRRY